MTDLATAPTAVDWASQINDRRHTDFSRYARFSGDDERVLALLVEGVHCGGCIRKIEKTLEQLPDVTGVRLNFSTRRLTVRWRGTADRSNAFADRLIELGYGVAPFIADAAAKEDSNEEKTLLRCLAVAGFAAGNVMLLSVAVWAGQFHTIDATTVDLLHWFSALVALPAVVYAGRPFFRSAFRVLRHGRTNMDVPISLAVLLTSGMSLFETIRGGEHTYFDSVVALLFFLLIGRFFDRRARGKARGAASRLLALQSAAVTVLRPDGRTLQMDQEEVVPGTSVLVAAGERIPVDGVVQSGQSMADTSLINGETVPTALSSGTEVFAGTTNIGAPITLEATKTADKTLLAEIVRLLETAEQRRARYVDLADRIARLYAPVVHILAAATFAAWFLVGLAWQQALLYAVAVLIITCPCALGLAVPVVQVIASSRLMRRGILVKAGNALERLSQIDEVVFDKTGTLTEGRPVLVGTDADKQAHVLAASMAAASKHPLSRALAASMPEAVAATDLGEEPGLGLALDTEDGEVRLGSRAWCGVADADEDQVGLELWLKRPKHPPVRFCFADELRSDAAEVVSGLGRVGLPVSLLSGDRPAAVALAATTAGIADWQGGCRPNEKVCNLERKTKDGHRPLMVGDGLNDAPALGAAHVSMSPATAADITQTSADIVFQGRRLQPVRETIDVARRADRLVKQNIGLSFVYNAIAIPFAVFGFVTPLVAAISMSASSLLVIGNAMRLSR